MFTLGSFVEVMKVNDCKEIFACSTYVLVERVEKREHGGKETGLGGKSAACYKLSENVWKSWLGYGRIWPKMS